jgi:hypothetical protein
LSAELLEVDGLEVDWDEERACLDTLGGQMPSKLVTRAAELIADQKAVHPVHASTFLTLDGQGQPHYRSQIPAVPKGIVAAFLNKRVESFSLSDTNCCLKACHAVVEATIAVPEVTFR